MTDFQTKAADLMRGVRTFPPSDHDVTVNLTASALAAAYEQGKRDEREACAKEADSARREYEKMADRASDDWGLQNIRDSEASVCGEIAAAIRKRGEA